MEGVDGMIEIKVGEEDEEEEILTTEETTRVVEVMEEDKVKEMASREGRQKVGDLTQETVLVIF